jgi:hypothetical protein
MALVLERPVRPPVHRSLRLTTQNGELVPKDADLQFGLRAGWTITGKGLDVTYVLP